MENRRQAVLSLLMLCAALNTGVLSNVFAQPVLEGIVREGTTALDYAVSLRIKEPAVRIGLMSSDEEVIVSSKNGIKILATSTGQDVWKPSYRGEIVFLPFGTPKERSKIFRIQVASFESKQQAEWLKKRIENETNLLVVIRYFPDRRLHQVRVGKETKKENLQPMVAQLKELGYTELWITEEFPKSQGDLFIRIVDEDYKSQVIQTDSLIVHPMKPSESLRVNGRSYRGYLEIRVYPTGEIRAINILHSEDYLKGVVPLEMGPEVWPEMEALKAQAVAARSYIIKNMGQFSEEGFDLCDTPRCQVYGGQSGEHPLSTQAVDATIGQIAVYDGLPINAFYTSTCGGMTEDAINIFPSEKGEYLKAVECYPDRQALVSNSYKILSSEEIPINELPGDPRLLRSLALLLVHGVLNEDFLKEEWNPQAEVREDEVVRLLLKSAGITGIKFKEPSIYRIHNIQDFWESASHIFSLRRRADLQINEKDIPSIIPQHVLQGYQRSNRKLIAYLVREKMIPEIESFSLVSSAKIRQEYLVLALSNLLSRFDGFQLKRGSFRQFSEKSIRFVSDKKQKIFPVSEKIIIFNLFGGKALPADQVQLIPGDRFYYHVDADDHIDYLERRPPIKGSSNDRYSIRYSWEVSHSREKLEEMINEIIPVGELKDLEVAKRGSSGRVIELLVRGNAGEFVLRGLHIRDALKLRETLFTMDKQFDSRGTLKAVIFNGKGWGHGVGLCQVGAYGMALRGSNYLDILKWYYRGIDVVRMYK
jgi:stage II sporulation protein D